MTTPTTREELHRLAARRHYEGWFGALIGCCEPSWDELGEERQSRFIEATAHMHEALEAAGLAVVPVEATGAMCEAGSDLVDVPPISTSQADYAYTAMLNASPFAHE